MKSQMSVGSYKTRNYKGNNDSGIGDSDSDTRRWWDYMEGSYQVPQGELLSVEKFRHLPQHDNQDFRYAKSYERWTCYKGGKSKYAHGFSICERILKDRVE